MRLAPILRAARERLATPPILRAARERLATPPILAALAIALSSGVAAAQGRVAGAPPHRSESALRAQLGVPVAERLLTSDDFASRIRGIERLGAIGTSEAIEALVDAMDQSSVAARDARARLTAVRVLAGEAKRDTVRQLLLREVTDTTGADGRGGVSPLAGMLRTTAALALARTGEKKAVSALVTALLQPGAASEAAWRALRAYPPASLESFLEGKKRLSPMLATFLGELGDLRAIERLRAMLGETDAAGKTAAAVALAKLGDDAALPIAREWLKKNEPRQRRAAAEVLVHLDAPDAPAAVALLLENEATREDALRLALLAPAPRLAAALAKALPDMPEEMRGRTIAAIGRARGVNELGALVDKPETALAAAFALATVPGNEAREAIERRLAGETAKKGDARRRLVRAGVLRALVLDDAPRGLEDRLRAMLDERAPHADRAAAVFGLVALGAMSIDAALGVACKGDVASACDAAILGAVARGALALPDGASSVDPLLPILARAAADADPRLAARAEPPSPSSVPAAVRPSSAIAIAAGVALLAHPSAPDLSTNVLASWAEAGGPLAPLAARALPARDDEVLRSRIKRLLEGSDPVVRAHVALGLASDPEASAVSLLTNAYRFEEDASVRRAVVRALSRRSEVQRIATLTLARDLDPDDEVRALARGALEGRALDPSLKPALGVEPRRRVAWVAIESNDASAKDAKDASAKDANARTARIVRSDGLAVPVVADPDGALLVPGLLPGATAILF